MEPSPPAAKKIRFGLFEVDLSAAELCRRGHKVPLQEQPFQVLALLLRHPGEVVTREELQQSLWPSDTFVEFDQSLNKAVQKIRQALGDSPDNARFVETIPRRGYRFIAPVELPVTAPVELPGQDELEGQKPQIGSPEPERGVAPAAETGRRFHRERAVWIIALAVAAAIIIVLWVRWPAPARLRKLAFTPQGQFDTPVISPDGRHIAYIITDPSDQMGRPTGGPVTGRLLIQDLDREAPREIEGTNGANAPFWSPDSEFVGFSSRKQLWKVPARSGSPVPVCELSDEFLGGSWSPDGNSMVFSINHQGIYEVSAGGGVPRMLIKVDHSAFNDHFDNPYLLPTPSGVRTLLYATQRTVAGHDIILHSPESGNRSVLVTTAVQPFYSPTGHVLYVTVSGDLSLMMALPFSPTTMKPTGEAFPIARSGDSPSVSTDGTLAYKSDEGFAHAQLNAYDRSGNKIATVGPVEDVEAMALSPDGQSLALGVNRFPQSDIWILNLNRGTKTRLTFSDQASSNPIWSPNGKGITYSSIREGSWEVNTTPADGSGQAKVLLAGRLVRSPNDWSPDGRFLVYQIEDPRTHTDLWYLKPKPGGNGYESVPFLQTQAAETEARFSPDGQFLAYVSDESGRSEVYVRHFPDGSGKRQISANGGSQPSWRRDGKELFYVEGDTLTSVAVTTRPDFSIGGSQRLVKNPYLAAFAGYVASADGQRFFLAEPSASVAAPVIRVVENWFAEFSRHGAKGDH